MRKCKICKKKFEPARITQINCSKKCLKKATAIYNIEYRKNNPERIKTLNKLSRQPERNARYTKKYRQSPRGKAKIKKARQRLHNKEYQKRYYKEHKQAESE